MDAECKKPLMKVLEYLRKVREVHLEVRWSEKSLVDGATYDQSPRQFPCPDNIQLHLDFQIGTPKFDKGFSVLVLPLLLWSIKRLTLRF